MIIFYERNKPVNRLISTNKISDGFSKYGHTPTGRLLEYQDPDRSFQSYSPAELLIGMGMDGRPPR